MQATVSGSTCTGPAHAYATYGSYTVTVSVTEKGGASGSASSPHVVTFAFAGFHSPVDNLPTLNTVKAGQAIPVKFSLAGFKGLDIFAAGFPTSRPISCSTSTLADPIEETATAGASSLAYDATTDTYRYVCQTDKSWGGTCRQLSIKLKDGTTYAANFKSTR